MPCMAHIEDAEAFGMMKEKLDKVHPGFLASCMDRSIVETEKLVHLLRQDYMPLKDILFSAK